MSPVIFSIGNFEIRWYSVLVLLAFAIGYFLVISRSKKKNLPITVISDMCFYLIIVCILGARIYYCLFNLNYYSKNILDIFKIWEGGLAIHGGIIAGIVFIYFYTKKKNINILDILDVFAPALVLGQAIGRWGNFFNQEAYGAITTLEHLKSLHIPNFIIEGMNINNNYYHPTFLYESLGCLLIFIIIIISRNIKSIKRGQYAAIYFVGYGVLRFFIESLRQDSLMLFKLKMAQVVSIIMIFIGIFIFIVPYLNKEKIRNSKSNKQPKQKSSNIKDPETNVEKTKPKPSKLKQKKKQTKNKQQKK